MFQSIFSFEKFFLQISWNILVIFWARITKNNRPAAFVPLTLDSRTDLVAGTNERIGF